MTTHCPCSFARRAHLDSLRPRRNDDDSQSNFRRNWTHSDGIGLQVAQIIISNKPVNIKDWACTNQAPKGRIYKLCKTEKGTCKNEEACKKVSWKQTVGKKMNIVELTSQRQLPRLYRCFENLCNDPQEHGLI